MVNSENNICIQCGLCCDGTLYAHADIMEGESIAPEYQFQITRKANGELEFRLGCCYLKEKKCTIYDHRPYRVCEKYTCALLRSFKAKETSYEDALNHINELSLLRSILLNDLNTNFNLAGDTISEKIESFRAYYSKLSNKEEFTKMNSGLLLNLAKFQHMKAKHFYKKKDENSLAEQVITSKI